MTLTILIETAGAQLPKDSLLEQLRHRLEEQAIEGACEFVKALNDAQWLKLENELRALGCSEWIRLFLKLLRITERAPEKAIQED